MKSPRNPQSYDHLMPVVSQGSHLFPTEKTVEKIFKSKSYHGSHKKPQSPMMFFRSGELVLKGFTIF